MRGGSGSHSACLTASSSTCSGGSSRCGLSTTEGSVPVLHSYTVQFPRICTNRSIGSTCSVGLQWSVPMTLLLPTCEARPRAGPGTQASRGESTSGEESAAGEVAQWSLPLSTGEKPGPSIPFTHEPHTGLVQVNGFAQGLGRCPDLGQLTG